MSVSFSGGFKYNSPLSTTASVSVLTGELTVGISEIARTRMLVSQGVVQVVLKVWKKKYSGK